MFSLYIRIFLRLRLQYSYVSYSSANVKCKEKALNNVIHCRAMTKYADQELTQENYLNTILNNLPSVFLIQEK